MVRDVRPMLETLRSLKEEKSPDFELARDGLKDKFIRILLGFEVDELISLDAMHSVVPDIFINHERPTRVSSIWVSEPKQIFEGADWVGTGIPLVEKEITHTRIRHWNWESELFEKEKSPWGIEWHSCLPAAPRAYFRQAVSEPREGKIFWDLSGIPWPAIDAELLKPLQQGIAREEWMALTRVKSWGSNRCRLLWEFSRASENHALYGAVEALGAWGIRSQELPSFWDYPELLARYPFHGFASDYLESEKIMEAKALGSIPVLFSNEEFRVEKSLGDGVVHTPEELIREYQSNRKGFSEESRSLRNEIEASGLWEHRLKQWQGEV